MIYTHDKKLGVFKEIIKLDQRFKTGESGKQYLIEQNFINS